MASEKPVPSSNAETVAIATTNGQTAFSFDWRADAANQVHAVYRPVGAPERVLVLGVDFSVQGLQNPAGGSILLVGFSANKDDVIYIYRETLIEREKKWQNEGDYKADLVNKEQDEIYMILQENRRGVKANSHAILSMEQVVNDAADRAEAAADDASGFKDGASDEADRARDEALRAEAAADSLNLPEIQPGDKGKVLTVNDTENGYDLEDVTGGGMITPETFGAVGDGVTDDTAAFVALEGQISGAQIPLGGKDYLVTKTFYKNIYSNGRWKVGSKFVRPNGDLSSNVPPLDVRVLASEKAAAIRTLPLAGGAGGQKTLQSFAIDPITRELFTNHNTVMSASDSSTASVVNRFVTDGVIIDAVDNATKDVRGGHQGLAVQYVNGIQKLWTTSPDAPENPANHPEFDYSIGGSKGAIRFRYRKEADGELYDFEQFRLFEASRSTGSSTTPTISLDGNWLIVRVSEGGARNQVVRVFDMTLFTASGDYSSMATHEFVWNYYDEMGTSVTSVSGFCSDGSHIYFFGGNNTFGQTQYLMSCTMLGENKTAAISDLGMTDFPRINGSVPSYMESEGMGWVDFDGVTYPGLIILADPSPFSGGTSRTAIIYALGARELRSRDVITKKLSISDQPETKPATLEFMKKVSAEGISLTFDVPARTGFGYRWDRGGVTGLALYQSTSNVVFCGDNGRDLGFGIVNDTGGSTILWKVLAGSYRPNKDAEYDFGLSNFRIRNSFFSVAPTISSDERLKSFGTIDEAEKAAALEIKSNLRKYKFHDMISEKGEDNARWHFGVSAQQVGSIMTAHGLEPHDYAFFCYDEWDETKEIWDDVPEVLDDEGNVISPAERVLAQEARPAGNIYGIRYDELLCFILAAI